MSRRAARPAELSADAADSASDTLRARAVALARPVAQLAPFVRQSMVVFGLGDELYALETRYVQQVQRFAEVTPLPGAAPHVLGVASVRGVLLAVFDLRVLLGVPRPQLGDLSRMLVLGEHQAELAIVADALHEVRQIDDAEWLELPASTRAATRPYLRGVTREALALFDGAALLSDPQLYVDDAVAP
jgi:purine-binding chemotaxis protein CheW